MNQITKTFKLLNFYKKIYYYKNRRTCTSQCLAATILAFIFGFVLGVLLPLYLFTSTTLSFGTNIRGFIILNRTNRADGEPTNLMSPLNIIINASYIFSVVFPQKNDIEYKVSSLDTLVKKRTNYALINKPTNIFPNKGIFWSAEIERQLPSGFDEKSLRDWRYFVNHSAIVKVEEGCGRMQNRLVTFDDGVRACSRYRQNNDQIQGEIFSFYLARLLGIQNLPPMTVGMVRGNEWQWELVRSYIEMARWSADRPIVLTQFVDKLTPSFIPEVFRNSSRRLHPYVRDLYGKTKREILELVQWSDLIVFDYLTANLDRVVNNMYNEQWNSEMMSSPAHNLAKSESTGLLVFLDNESGLLHGYRLLDKYETYHLSLLKSLCVFKYSTVRALETLRNKSNVSYLLKEMFEKISPRVRDWLPFIPDRYLKILSERIKTVYRHVLDCHKRYGSGDILGFPREYKLKD